ncbi:MAG TPA: TRAP transporter small permease [Thiolinea sp.]|nr:TRAP transporter small permease [Thiolinea sp.]
MRTALDRLYRLGGGLAALFIVAITLLVFAQVVLNLVDRLAKLFTGTALGLTIPSYSDFTGFFLAAASFLALAYTLQAGEHIRINLITSRLPKRLQHLFELSSVTIALALTLYMVWYMALMVYEAWQYHDMSSGVVAVPLWIPQSSLVVGLVILAIALVDNLILLLQGKPARYMQASPDPLAQRGGE